MLLLSVSGCETLFNQPDGAGTTSHPGGDTTNNGSSEAERLEVAAYLDFVDVLDKTDEQGWHTVYEHTLQAFEQTPSRETRMRLALVMSRSDRMSGESKVTRNLLIDSRELFDDTVQDTVPTPALVRKFAQLQLNEIDRRLALYEELHSLRTQLAKAHQANQTAQRDRTITETRMRQIDAELAEANAKLEAVLKIERNIGPTGKETYP